MNCRLCDEPVSGDQLAFADGSGFHRECGLREVLGGIGHLIAHDYWCNVKHDPDAGLTFRQSALLADAWVHVMGVEAAAALA